MFLLQKSNKKVSSRFQIRIKKVKDGILTLPDNRYCLVLHASSINFELKSEAEQDALIEVYQSVLNTLSSPIQILICVREMDLDKYVDGFRAKLQNEAESIYRSQIKSYTNFVSKLVAKNKILSRSFYVIVPFEAKQQPDIELVNEQLRLNADIVIKGLARLGMRLAQLTSLELLDLLYGLYNPQLAKTQPFTQETLELLRTAYL
jgi:hypothetical protein